MFYVILVDWRMFRKIRTSEFLVKAWSGNERDKNAPNLLAFVNIFNKMTNWIASQILLCANSDRVRYIEKFIDLAQALRAHDNYHGVVEVFAALNLLCIQKLTSAWQSVSRKHIETIRAIEQLLDNHHNWQAYRKAINGITDRSFIPFEGVFLSDLTSIQENVDAIDDQVNFEKLMLLGRAFQLIKHAQSFSYVSFAKVPIFEQFIDQGQILDEDQLWQVSLKVQSKSRFFNFSMRDYY